MTLAFLRFELREQLRSPLLWLLAALFALLAFGAASSDAIQIGGGIGNVHRNAPSVIATLMTSFTLIGLLLKLVSDLTYMLVDPRIDFGRRDL